MKNNFWEKLKKEKPIYALAPMAGITDSAFRQMCKNFGADVLYSEMASVNALVYAPEKTLKMLKFSELERPYVVQLFGSEPKNFRRAIKIIEKKIKPDGIDINFGCPAPKVAKQEAGAELFKNLEKSRAVIEAVLDAASLPVSIKFRRQVGEVDAIAFLKNIVDLDIKAIMIHGRDLKQHHSGPVDAQIIKEARQYFSGVILANGGVIDYDSAQKLLSDSAADGLGVGQGALGHPWVFKQIKDKNFNLSQKEIFSLAIRHAELAFKLRGQAGILEMRKHLCWYTTGIPEAGELRRKLVKVEKIEEAKEILGIN